jgi:hypothetical protein
MLSSIATATADGCSRFQNHMYVGVPNWPNAKATNQRLTKTEIFRDFGTRYWTVLVTNSGQSFSSTGGGVWFPLNILGSIFVAKGGRYA